MTHSRARPGAIYLGLTGASGVGRTVYTRYMHKLAPESEMEETVTDKNTFYITPPLRRAKRKRPNAIHMKIGGRWETFTSKAELLTFMQSRKEARA